MSRLTDMVENEEVELDMLYAKEALIEALETLIEMVEEDALTEDEMEMLDNSIEFITEDFDDEDLEEELSEATLNKMSPKELMKARKYRLKNKAKLKKASKKRAMKNKKFKKAREKCAAKISAAGIGDKYGCNIKGKRYRKKTRK